MQINYEEQLDLARNCTEGKPCTARNCHDGSVECCGYVSGSYEDACGCMADGGYDACDVCGGAAVTCKHEYHCPECRKGADEADLKAEGMCYECFHKCVCCDEREGVYETSSGDPICGECMYTTAEHVVDQITDR